MLRAAVLLALIVPAQAPDDSRWVKVHSSGGSPASRIRPELLLGCGRHQAR